MSGSYIWIHSGDTEYKSFSETLLEQIKLTYRNFTKIVLKNEDFILLKNKIFNNYKWAKSIINNNHS